MWKVSEKKNKEKKKQTSKQYQTGQNPLDVSEFVKLQLRRGAKQAMEKVYMIKNLSMPLLGKPAIIALGLLIHVDSETVRPSKHVTLNFAAVWVRYSNCTLSSLNMGRAISLKTPRRIPVLFFRESQRRVSMYGQPERHQPRRAANWMVCRHGGRAEEEQEVCTLVCGPDWLKRAHVPWKVHSTQSGTESWNACQSEKVPQTGRHHGDERAKKCMRVEEFSFGQSAGKFIPQLSEKDKPLHDLLPKKNCWVWDVYQVTAF